MKGHQSSTISEQCRAHMCGIYQEPRSQQVVGSPIHHLHSQPPSRRQLHHAVFLRLGGGLDQLPEAEVRSLGIISSDAQRARNWKWRAAAARGSGRGRARRPGRNKDLWVAPNAEATEDAFGALAHRVQPMTLSQSNQIKSNQM